MDLHGHENYKYTNVKVHVPIIPKDTSFNVVHYDC